MTDGGTLWIAFAIVVLVVLLARSRARAENKDKRGTEPGQGDQLIDNSFSSGIGGGHSSVTRVTRDPQKYAKAFIPANAENKTGAKTTGGPDKS